MASKENDSYLQEVSFSEEEVLFDNLLALGFSEYLSEAKIPPQVPIDKDSFKVPNPNAFYIVSHFLFSVLDSEKCGKEFHSCWPVTTKKDAQEFRRICSRWLKEIIQEEYEFPAKIPVPSLLLAPGGQKFCHLYLGFSRHVLKKTIQKISPSTFEGLLKLPNLKPSYALAAMELVMSHTIMHAEDIKEVEARSHEHSKVASESMRTLMDTYYKQKKFIEECPGTLKQMQEQLSICEADYQRLVTECSALWEKLELVNKHSKQQTKILQKALSNLDNFGTLDADDYKVKLSKQFLAAHREDIEEEKVGELYKNKMLNIENFLKLAKITILQYEREISSLSKIKIDKRFGQLKDIQENLSKKLAELNLAVSTDLIPDIRSSISNLKNLDVAETSVADLQNECFGAYKLKKSTPTLKAAEIKNEENLWTEGVLCTPKFLDVKTVKNENTPSSDQELKNAAKLWSGAAIERFRLDSYDYSPAIKEPECVEGIIGDIERDLWDESMPSMNLKSFDCSSLFQLNQSSLLSTPDCVKSEPCASNLEYSGSALRENLENKFDPEDKIAELVRNYVKEEI